MSTLNSRLQLSLLNRKKNQNILEKGFTLVELMIVIVVVGVLSAVALPNFLGVKTKATAGAEIGQFVGLAKECSSAILIDGPFPDAYPAAIVGDGAGKVNINCINATGDGPPAANVVFTSTVVPDELDEAVNCGPGLKIAKAKSCVITVNSTNGGIDFTSST